METWLVCLQEDHQQWRIRTGVAEALQQCAVRLYSALTERGPACVPQQTEMIPTETVQPPSGTHPSALG